MRALAIFATTCLAAGPALAHADPAPHMHGPGSVIIWVPVALAALAIAYRGWKK